MLRVILDAESRCYVVYTRDVIRCEIERDTGVCWRAAALRFYYFDVITQRFSLTITLPLIFAIYDDAADARRLRCCRCCLRDAICHGATPLRR